MALKLLFFGAFVDIYSRLLSMFNFDLILCQITTEVALVLLTWATILLTFPFKYILSFLLLDMFTRELEFRREMVKKFKKFLRERWHAVPCPPVAVLPFENEESRSEMYLKEFKDQPKSQGKQGSGKS